MIAHEGQTGTAEERASATSFRYVSFTPNQCVTWTCNKNHDSLYPPSPYVVSACPKCGSSQMMMSEKKSTQRVVDTSKKKGRK